ncbi:hypothetical protein pb186bvf_015555 [Paramecium bursaria]
MLCFILFFHFYYVSPKMIASNTIQKRDSVQLFEENINLTIWMQIRHPLYSEQVILEALRIVDQNNSDHLLIVLMTTEQNKMIGLDFKLFNKTQISWDFIKEKITFEWQKITVERNVCFKRLYYLDIDLSITCNSPFNATLYIIQSINLHIYVYDREELLNEEIILSNLFLEQNLFTVNTFKNNLVIKFYAKFYCHAYDDGLFFSIQIQKKVYLIYQIYEDSIVILFLDQEMLIIDIAYDQWVLFGFEFNQRDIIIQYNIDNKNNQKRLSLDKYYNLSDSEYLNYLFITNFALINSNAIQIKYLQIINLIENSIICSNCLFCLYKECFDKQKKLKIQSSSYYEQYQKNYNSQCQYKSEDFINGTCVEYPKYIGQYCYNCHIMKEENIHFLDKINFIKLSLIISYESQLGFVEDQINYSLSNNGLSYQQDLNIFIMNSQKDLYLTYMTYYHYYCETGYTFENKCRKLLKQCQLHLQICLFCHQSYALIHKKCIRCQKNCLYCILVNKTLSCILYKNQYYQSRGLIYKCTNNSLVFNCLSIEQAIQARQSIMNVTFRGHKVCQQNQIYDVDTYKCFDFIKYKYIFRYIQSYPKIKNDYDHYLEIQEQLIIQKQPMDKQIYSLINLQQLNKLAEQVQKYNQNQTLLNKYRNVDLLSQMKSLIQDTKIQQITLNVSIFLEKNPIIIYQNKSFFNIIDIYRILQIQFKIVQFNIVIMQYPKVYNQTYYFGIDYENFKNIKFIFNITFNIRPSIFYKNSIRFYFKAHQLIFSNLIFDFRYKYQRMQLEEPVLKIVSLKITINNVLLINQTLINVFHLQNFSILTIENVWIIKSNLKEFIKAINQDLKSHPIVKISNVCATQTTFTDFLVLENVGHFHINIFIIENTTINGFIFNIIGQFYFVHLSNLQFDGFLDLKAKSQKNRIIIFNVYICQASITNSSLFYVLNGDNLQLGQIYLYDVFLQRSNVIHLLENIFIILEQINIHTYNSEDISNVIKVLGDTTIFMSDFYFYKILLIRCNQLMIVYGNQIEAINFNLIQIEQIAADLIIFSAQLVDIKQFLFYNFTIVQSLRHSVSVSASNFLSIQGIVFKQFQVNKTQLLLIDTNRRSFLKNMHIVSFIIFNDDYEQLIAFHCGIQNNFIQQLVIDQFNINNQKKGYLIFKLINQRSLTIIKLYIRKIANLSPDNQVYIIENQLFQLKIYQALIYDTISVNFLQSSSNILILQLFKVYDIEKTWPFIYHNSTFVNYPKETVEIRELLVMYFFGLFIQIETETQILIILESIQFQNFITDVQLFKLLSTSLQQSKLLMTTLNFQNQYYEESYQSEYSLIETTFDVVKINQVYIKNICTQLFFIWKSQDTSLIDIYISQYRFIYSIFAFNIEIDKNSTLIIINCTIIDTIILNSSVIELFLSNFNIVMENIKFINTRKLFFVIDYQDQQSCFKRCHQQTSSYFKSVPRQISIGPLLLEDQLNMYLLVVIQQDQHMDQSLVCRQSCSLSENSLITINQSEIVNSNVMQHYDKFINYNSQFQGMVSNINQEVMIFLSLNQGRSIFNINSIQKNLYQVQFSKNNSYLYLPSGRDVEYYKYFNFKTQDYQQLYDSISYVSLYQTKSQKCTLQQNFNNQTIYESELLLLPGVNKINNITFTLNPYNKDKYIELDLICNQNESQITYRTLIKTFNCQLGEHLIQDQCILCDIQSYLYSVGYNQQYCLYQDQNVIEQLKIGQIKLFKQFWRHSYANKYIEQCKNYNCLGGWYPGDSSCVAGYLGALCSECDVYNVRGLGSYGKIDNQCTQCFFDYSIYLKGLVLLLFQLTLIFINYYSNQQQSQQYLFLRISKRKFTEILLRQNVNQVAILLKLYYNYLFTLYLLKDLINFGQFIDLSLNVIYNPSFIAIPQFDCLINQYFQYPIQYTQLLQKILVPIVILNVIVIIYTILIKFKLAKYSVYVILVCLLIIHQQNQQIILQRYLFYNILQFNQVIAPYQIFQHLLDFGESQYRILQQNSLTLSPNFDNAFNYTDCFYQYYSILVDKAHQQKNIQQYKAFPLYLQIIQKLILLLGLFQTIIYIFIHGYNIQLRQYLNNSINYFTLNTDSLKQAFCIITFQLNRSDYFDVFALYIFWYINPSE